MTSQPQSPPTGVASILGRVPELLSPVVKAYRRRLLEFGATPQGVFWRNQVNVDKRFEVLLGIFDAASLAGEITVNDFGCGYGAFFDVLQTHPAMRGSRYVGYDVCTDMLDAAQKRIRDPRATFVRSAAPTETADYSFASGTFNLKLEAQERPWDEYVKALLGLLWQKTTKGLAFNMLDIRQKRTGDGLFYADPAEFGDFCRTAFSPKVEPIENYGLPDWTMLVRR